MRGAVLLLLLVTVAAAQYCFGDRCYASMAHNANRTALPDDVVPSVYALRIHVKLDEFAFSGEQEVDVDVRRATDTVTVNGKDVQVQSAEFVGVGKATVSYDDAKERILFKFEKALPVGQGKLKVAFTGTLNDKLKGFYRSKYSVNGEDRYMAVTQFEPVDARRAFPCWDEPAVKARFDVTLVVPQNRTAISNMPVVEEKAIDNGLKAVKFDRTPIMSTYLLAFVVGEFDVIQDKTSSGVLVRCFTTPGKAEQGRFALEVAVKTLPFYDEYFGIPYPLPKMDLLAIPDFAAGAMENWGCVTYRETALLYDPQNSSSTAKQYIAIVVGHELAHQWFGNLVTMDWWTHLWLNEGFASWIEYLAVDHCFPEWDIWTQFVYSDLGRAMNLDGLANSHPVEVPINDPAEIDEIFDAISYSKGCSIIRMLASWLGTESFKKGLHNYLKHFAYKNALTEDLWHFLGEASGKPVKELMDTWTKITGYPVVSVKEAGILGHTRHYEITQQRFLSSGPVPNDKSLWQIPLGLIAHKDQHNPAFSVLKHHEGKVSLNSGADDWVKFNPGQTGFYRVQYPPIMLEKLRHGIEKLELSPIDRLGVENDALSLAKAGFLGIGDALSVARAFVNETDYTVWADLNSKLAEIEVIVSNTPFLDLWKTFGRNLYKKVLERVGWDPKPGEKHTVGMLRALVILKSGSYGDQAVIAEAKRRFAAYLDNPAALAPDLRSAVYQTVLANDASSFDALMKLYAKTTLQEEKVRIQRSLGALSDPALLTKVLDWSMSDEVRLQDAVFIVVAVAANPKGRELAWQFVQKNFDALAKKYEGGFLLGHLVRVPQHFASDEKAAEVEKFYGSKNLPGVERTVRQAVESIRSNAKWLHRDQETIHKWLQAHAHFA